MSGQAVVADVGPVHQPAHHHVPAQQSLQPTQNEHPGQTQAQATVHLPRDQEVSEGYCEHQPDHAPQQPVRAIALNPSRLIP